MSITRELHERVDGSSSTHALVRYYYARAGTDPMNRVVLMFMLNNRCYIHTSKYLCLASCFHVYILVFYSFGYKCHDIDEDTFPNVVSFLKCHWYNHCRCKNDSIWPSSIFFAAQEMKTISHAAISSRCGVYRDEHGVSKHDKCAETCT